MCESEEESRDMKYDGNKEQNRKEQLKRKNLKRNFGKSKNLE